MSFKMFILAVVAIFVLVAIWNLTFGKTHYYPNQSECVRVTGKACVYSSCDHACRMGTKGSGWIVDVRP